MADTSNAEYVIEQLWARIGERLSEEVAPPEGWPLETLSSGIRSTLGNATTAYSAVTNAVAELNTSNGGRLLRVNASGTIVVPEPSEETDPTPRNWVLTQIDQAIAEFSAEVGLVTSVNGKTGPVTLTAADVGARQSGVPLSISEITGLQDDLDSRATESALNSLDNAINGRISSSINSSLAPIENSIFLISTNLSSLTEQFEEIETKPTGGWRRGDLSSEVNHHLDRITAATSNRTGETLPFRNSSGTFMVGDPTHPSHPSTKKYVDDNLSSKADSSQLTALSNRVNGKADSSTVTAVSGDLTALTSRVKSVEDSLGKKVELGTGGVFPVNYIPELGISKVSGLQSALDSKPTLTDGAIPLSAVPSGIPQEAISGLSAKFSEKADLISGKIPSSQIPAIATHETYPVPSKAAMLALTTSQVQIGDTAIITTAGNDQGTYTLINSDPSRESSWLRHQAPQDAVLSVNGKQGTVVLSASDVGARALGGAITQGDVTGLTNALNARTTKTYVDGELAGKTSPTDVTAIASGLGSNKQPVDLVATNNQLTLSGLRSIDGVLVQSGQRVLLTSQQASSANGIYVVSTGEWTRGADAPNGSSLIPGTAVIIKDGAEHAQTIWQLTNSSPVIVGTGGQQWAKGYSGKEQASYTAGHGLQLEDERFSVRLGASSGLVSDSAGLRLDPSSAVRKVSLSVPSGAAIGSLTHNLGTNDISVTFIDNASQEMVLVPWVVSNSNRISYEFASPVPSNAYRAVIIG